MKKIYIIGLFVVLAWSIHAQTIKIGAAGNLRFVLDEIKTEYLKVSPKCNIMVTLSSSGALFQQISNGANFDIYMAADKKYPDKLKEQGLVKGIVKTYVFGKLILWSNTLNMAKGLDILTSPQVKRIAVAKPETAPYGDRAIQCLKYYGIYEKVKDKIVYADNIAQAAQFAQTGNAEVGMLALALAMTPDMKGSYFEIDPKSYKPVEQAMVLLKSWESNPEAGKFMDFVLSAACKPIFEKYGFIVPDKK